jgi:hypothetical protein
MVSFSSLLPEPVATQAVAFTAPLEEALARLPRFERQPLQFDSPSIGHLTDPHSELIVRVPSSHWPVPAIVGLVSPQYQLLPHEVALEQVARQVLRHDQGAASDAVSVYLSPNGARMSFSLALPELPWFDPGDGYPVCQRLGGINSVDRHLAFQLFLEWLRLVCRNGMVARMLSTECYQRHTGGLRLDKILPQLAMRQAAFEADAAVLRGWVETPIDLDLLPHWVDQVVAPAWGPYAATRVFHILTRGCDVVLRPTTQPLAPSQRPVSKREVVPGAVWPAPHLYAVAQALTWLAGRQRQPQSRWQWQQAVPRLIAAWPT